MTYAEFKKNMLHEMFSKSRSYFIRDWQKDDELHHVTHYIHESYVTIPVIEMTRYPKIGM